MTTPKGQAEIDQEMAQLCDILALLWHNLFVELCKQGFSEVQALDLVKTYILSMGSNK